MMRLLLKTKSQFGDYQDLKFLRQLFFLVIHVDEQSSIPHFNVAD